MKLAIKIVLVICAVIGIGIIIMISVAVIGYKILFSVPPDPPKPEVTYGEFDFELTFEVNGEIHTINDTFVCTFAGIGTSAFAFPVKGREWEEHFKSEPENGRLVIYQIDDTYSITLHTYGYSAMYLMSDPGGESHRPDTEPLILVFNSEIGNYDSNREAILENCGFKIINWYCDPPIENSFK